MRKFLRYWALVLTLGLVPLQSLWSQVVIAHPGVQTGVLSPTYLFALFSLRIRHWPQGQPATLVVFKDEHPAHIHFVKQDLGVFPYQLRSIWDRYIFSGAVQAPRTVETAEQMINWVSATEGAIGYLDSSMGDVPGVRVIEIK
ncbi:hypothetical protein [Marinobacterium rhizophilum]|uniref:hypothetical protein n=1 Tax=Marinobacterium rhizophilum TaxID=420402 RepID=UPI00035E13F1|nr:hypothetical protein [Marinobacterium rhizophilum]